MNSVTKVEIVSGLSKEKKLPWKALKITIGDWSQLIFTESFAMKYIEEQLAIPEKVEE